MTATTHTEVYRRYTGTPQYARLRFTPLLASGLRVAFKGRWGLLLYLPPLIALVVFGFIVYAKFSLEQGVTPGALTGERASAGVAMVGNMASQLLEVRDIAFGFIIGMSTFSVLIAGWYGAGLIAEDRRAGAHLLYFARPLSKLDYALGKLGVVVVMTSLGMFVPSLLLFLVATLTAPGWTFLQEHGWMFAQVVGYALVHTLVLGSIVLAISSLSSKRTYALAGVAAYFMASGGVATLLAVLMRDRTWFLLAPIANLRRVGAHIFGVKRAIGVPLDWSPWWSWLVLAGLCGVCWTIVALRLRRMEAVA